MGGLLLIDGTLLQGREQNLRMIKFTQAMGAARCQTFSDEARSTVRGVVVMHVWRLLCGGDVHVVIDKHAVALLSPMRCNSIYAVATLQSGAVLNAIGSGVSSMSGWEVLKLSLG